jgi:serine/threonine protein kinase
MPSVEDVYTIEKELGKYEHCLTQPKIDLK